MSDEDHVEAYTKGPKQLVTTRESGYKNKAGGLGYCGWKRQVHHVIPCVSATQSKEDFLDTQDEPGPAKRALERITKYDVNERENLIGLPSQRVYAAKYCKPFAVVPKVSKLIDALKKPLIAECDWPIHLWNHPEYSRQVKVAMMKIWANAAIKIENHQPVSAKNLHDDIQGVSDDYRKKLEKPSKKKKRTQEAWQSGDKSAFDII